MVRNKDFVTCKQVAFELGLTPDYVCRLVRGGKIKGKKLGNNWLIDPNGYKKVSRQRFPRK